MRIFLFSSLISSIIKVETQLLGIGIINANLKEPFTSLFLSLISISSSFPLVLDETGT